MARKRTLLTLLQDFRAEIGASGNPAHNSSVREAHVRILQRTQELLWESTNWPHLRVRRYANLQAGERYYDTPEDMPIERVERIDVRDGDEWCRLHYGISNGDYSTFDSFKDERSWPVERWQIYEDEMVEFWPIPASNTEEGSGDGTIRFTGIRALKPLVKDTDRADLDDRLIVLHAAAEHLASRGDAKAPLIAKAADKRLRSLTSNMSKIKQFSLFGAGRQSERREPHIPRIHYRDRETQ
ncbi:hypothetical protein RZ532_00945 [Nitratireductor aquimarinus]|uniref:phage adaptor protein n=1 Tax=Nitratireductor aquimarinus TaxID=889300 RepID=UPI0029353C69|nr:hypothetical protein [Nitratireductor aquimarinus]MDV2964527.1 hypothetical protein [Nitratireductor aquimarinus]